MAKRSCLNVSRRSRPCFFWWQWLWKFIHWRCSPPKNDRKTHKHLHGIGIYLPTWFIFMVNEYRYLYQSHGCYGVSELEPPPGNEFVGSIRSKPSLPGWIPGRWFVWGKGWGNILAEEGGWTLKWWVSPTTPWVFLLKRIMTWGDPPFKETPIISSKLKDLLQDWHPLTWSMILDIRGTF